MRGLLILFVYVDLIAGVPAFVERYCIDCHDAETAKGERDFEPYLANPDSADHHDTLIEILEQLNLGEMPPQKKRVAQPSDAERRAVVDELTRYLTAAEITGKPSSTVMRRLTRYEYNYSIRDLLGIDTDAADMTRRFPVDRRVHGFANLGSSQALSDYQLRLYMETARQYLDLALVLRQKRPVPQKWVFPAAKLSGQAKNAGSVVYHVWAKDRSSLDIGQGQPVPRYPAHPVQFARSGVPHTGVYRLRVKATAVGRTHPYDSKIYPNDLNMPLKMGIWHVPNADLLKRGASEGRVLLKIVDLPDDKTAEFAVDAWMPAGSIPFVNWMNGPGSSKTILERVIRRYHPEADRRTAVKRDALLQTGKHVPNDYLDQKVYISDVYQGPRVRVFEMGLEGPLHEQWPPAGHRNVFGGTTDPQKVGIADTLTEFASKAFRRPVPQSEIRHYIHFVRQKIADGVSRADAITQGLAAILSSPRFLFLDEGDPAESAALDDYQLASRLSYALWCSMPDEQLLSLAADGKLRTPQILAEQVERMLDDPRAAAFAQHFGDAWLQLYKIGSMPPGDRQFPTYYRERLESAMKTETRLVIADALRHNRPVTQFLHAKRTFVNDSLAKHYGLPDIRGEEFRPILFSKDERRAGLLGHASVLTATANGVETSPVVRGVWVLENILGTPPAPPPPDVPSIEPDTRGATTIREQLAKHRSVPACADCHAKIDPWGFALEFYDPIGGVRNHYPRVRGKAAAIDGSGKLPGGAFIHNAAGLRQQLAQRKDQFTRNLVRKFLIHATGRELTFRDQAEVEQITKQLAESGYGFRDLVRACSESQVFRNR